VFPVLNEYVSIRLAAFFGEYEKALVKAPGKEIIVFRTQHHACEKLKAA